MTQFFAGIVHLVRAVPAYIDIFKTLFRSDTFPLLREFIADEITEIRPAIFSTKAFRTYNKTKKLYAEGQYEEAGAELINGIFNDHQVQTAPSVEWSRLPYDGDMYPGEDVAGYMAGLIYHFTDEEMNYDNLAACVSSQDILKESFQEAIGSIQKRTNDDISVGLAHLRAIFLGLDSNVANCSE